MARSEIVRLLYVGRRQEAARKLRSAIKADEDVASAAELRNHQKIIFSVVTNQRAALDFTRDKTPAVLLIELDGKTDSRKRFCDMMRYRLPQAVIISVSKFDVDSSFEFDGHIPLPLQPLNAVETINRCMDKLVSHKLERGHIQLNIAQRTVVTPAGEHHMTPKQCALLNMLMRNHNLAVKREDIMREIWDTEFMEDTRTLDVHIRWLRQVIESTPSKPKYLVTIRRIGYRLRLE